MLLHGYFLAWQERKWTCLDHIGFVSLRRFFCLLGGAFFLFRLPRTLKCCNCECWYLPRNLLSLKLGTNHAQYACLRYRRAMFPLLSSSCSNRQIKAPTAVFGLLSF